ncbi:signal peptidase II [Clostridiaceae bacterium M8S5]|nr:signal peptidase II [Clostridiaceae bacterium M8S5]
MLYFVIGLISFMIDQISKYIVDIKLDQFERVHLFRRLYLVKVYNHGGAYGLFKNKKKFLIIVTTIATIVLILLGIYLEPYEYMLKIGFAFMVGGALGNLIDRIRLGYVVDYIYIKVNIKKAPIFNIADISILIGVIIILIYDIIELV